MRPGNMYNPETEKGKDTKTRRIWHSKEKNREGS
jgi:hypothetical protein